LASDLLARIATHNQYTCAVGTMRNSGQLIRAGVFGYELCGGMKTT
jgi:hypothetical protein